MIREVISNSAEKQVKAKKRVSLYGEVFTGKREVKAMLDLIPKSETERPDSTFLEPACGEGAFTVEILSRKLNAILRDDPQHFERLSLVAVSSIYAIELLPDNRTKAIQNMLAVWTDFITGHNELDFAIIDRRRNDVLSLLDANFVLGNTLTCRTAKNEPIRFYEWRIDDMCNITGEPHIFEAMLNPSSGYLF